MDELSAKNLYPNQASVSVALSCGEIFYLLSCDLVIVYEM